MAEFPEQCFNYSFGAMGVGADRPLQARNFSDAHRAVPDDSIDQLNGTGDKRGAERTDVENFLMGMDLAGAGWRAILDNARCRPATWLPQSTIRVLAVLSMLVATTPSCGMAKMKGRFLDSAAAFCMNIFCYGHVVLVIQAVADFQALGRQKRIGHSAADGHEISDFYEAVAGLRSYRRFWRRR